ncbi:MAG: glycosyltransferase family 4 protein [Actinobacteria bacterium]|nr:glycosyltransferase family 4 protein [Actinomycetota bacterium]
MDADAPHAADRPTDAAASAPQSLSLCWLALPGSRPGREPSWLAGMPGAEVTVVGDEPTGDPVTFVHRPYRRLSGRFVEAGALAWFRDLDSLDVEADWVAALELCALVTGQIFGVAERAGARTAVLTWGNDAGNPMYRIPPYRFATERAKHADLFVCMIDAALRHCVELGIPEERCRVVHPPLDTELFSPSPAGPVDEPVALFCSPIDSNKGIDRVLDAFQLVRARLPEAKLRVLGRGPLVPMVEERAAATDGAVEYLGVAGSRAEVADQLRAAALLVTAPRPTPVWNEQFGLAYVEAQACGLPVVTTACGSNHEAVWAPNLRVADDAGQLAEAMIHFLANPSERARVGAINRAAMIEHFEQGQQLKRLREAFDSMG